MSPLLLYIHGFNSSPHSLKAMEVSKYVEQQALGVTFVAPALPNYPGEAWRQLEQTLAEQLQQKRRKVALIGSSLGGYYATALAELFQIKAVLVNPAVRPYDLMAHTLGANQNPYSGEEFYLHEGHVDELRAVECDRLQHPSNLLLMVQKGDETLDYRHAVDYYTGCPHIIEEAGDHGFQQFKRHLPEVMQFLALTD